MVKMTVAALGGLVLLAGASFAAPPPNDVGVTGMGGSAYYNPYLHGSAEQPPTQAHGDQPGTVSEGQSVHDSNAAR
jgi:hypothetical protein